MQPVQSLIGVLGADELVAIPLRGYVVCNLIKEVFTFVPLCEVAIPLRGYVVCNRLSASTTWWALSLSQSPYGAMWFATAKALAGAVRLTWEVAIPLRGYVVCNPKASAPGTPGGPSGRNPLTGLCGLQLMEAVREERLVLSSSQSPYGAMWFATSLC